MFIRLPPKFRARALQCWWRCKLRFTTIRAGLKMQGGTGRPAADRRDELRHLLAVSLVLLAVQHDEVALLPTDSQQHVAGRQRREQQVRASHYGRCPEGDLPTDIQRMPHVLVEQGRAELQMGIWFPRQVQPHLPQSKQVEVVNQKGADQDQPETQETEAVQRSEEHTS